MEVLLWWTIKKPKTKYCTAKTHIGSFLTDYTVTLCMDFLITINNYIYSYHFFSGILETVCIIGIQIQ